MSTQEALEDFQNVYDATYDDVLKYVVCNVSSIQDVADIIQEIYLAVYKKIKKDITKEYILGIAKHKIKDYYRFRYKRKEYIWDTEYIFEVPDDINLLELTIQKNQIDFVWNYLKNKKCIIGKIFFLYYYENYSLKEIANILNLSESNVKHYLYRTLKEINLFLGREDKNEEV